VGRTTYNELVFSHYSLYLKFGTRLDEVHAQNCNSSPWQGYFSIVLGTHLSTWIERQCGLKFLCLRKQHVTSEEIKPRTTHSPMREVLIKCAITPLVLYIAVYTVKEKNQKIKHKHVHELLYVPAGRTRL